MLVQVVKDPYTSLRKKAKNSIENVLNGLDGVSNMKSAKVNKYSIMRFKEFSKIKKRYDQRYGYDPELLVYKHKIGPIYGKKNPKVPTQNIHQQTCK